MSVTAFVGLWGSGKTLALTEACIGAEADGFRVASNFGFVGGLEFATLGELLQLLARKPRRDLLYVALDEAGMLFPAREFSKWPPALNVLMQQGRKLGVSLGYTSQSFDFVDANLRRVTGVVVKCSGFGSKLVSAKGVRPREYRPLWFMRTHYDAQGYGLARTRPLKRQLYVPFRQETADRYDTWHLIDACQQVLDLQAGEVGAST